MKRFSVLSVLIIMSCSHLPEESKIVSLPFAPKLVESIQNEVNRAPASIEIATEEGKSPRRVYFSALYHQYLTMGHHLGKPSEMAFCPQFHHDKIETDHFMVPNVSLYKAKNIVEEGKEYFPELVFSKKFSLLDHHEAIETELKVLCEEGSSDNYFKFDNLITHYATKKSFHTRPDAMKSILKIPVFANYYLLKMLQSPHTMTIVHPEEKLVIKLTQTHWFEKYVAQAHRMRNNFIKDKMVQR